MMTTDNNQQQAPDQEQESRDWKQARAKIAKLEDRVAALRHAAISSAVKAAGYDPNSKLTQLVIREFEQQLGDDDEQIAVDTFTEFATEQGLEPTTSVQQQEEEEDRTNEQDQQRLTNTADQLSAAAQTHTPPPPGDYDEQIVQAQQTGDMASSAALKFRQFQEALDD